MKDPGAVLSKIEKSIEKLDIANPVTAEVVKEVNAAIEKYKEY